MKDEVVYWKQRDGKLISIDDMDINHLRNTLKMLINNKNKHKYKWFSSKTYLQQHEISDKYFGSKNPSLLTKEQVVECYDKEHSFVDINKIANNRRCHHPKLKGDMANEFNHFYLGDEDDDCDTEVDLY